MNKQPVVKSTFAWLPFLVVLVPCLWGCAFWLWDWVLAAIATLLSVYLVFDLWQWVRRKRATHQDS